MSQKRNRNKHRGNNDNPTVRTDQGNHAQGGGNRNGYQLAMQTPITNVGCRFIQTELLALTAIEIDKLLHKTRLNVRHNPKKYLPMLDRFQARINSAIKHLESEVNYIRSELNNPSKNNAGPQKKPKQPQQQAKTPKNPAAARPAAPVVQQSEGAQADAAKGDTTPATPSVPIPDPTAEPLAAKVPDPAITSVDDPKTETDNDGTSRAQGPASKRSVLGNLRRAAAAARTT